MEKVVFDVSILKKDHFRSTEPKGYDKAWITDIKGRIPILRDDSFDKERENNSWSAEVEEIHEESAKKCWIDIYQRDKVMQTVSEIVKSGNNTIVEFGASSGYMIKEMKKQFPNNVYISADLMEEGLLQSYKNDQDVVHVRCDFTDAPFKDESVDLIYSLNVLEHIEDDTKAISECYRVLKPNGKCLFVVPRGCSLYDYYDEMLFHKRRYATRELKSKCIRAGFEVEKNFHFAWLVYPAFYVKKKWNRFFGNGLTHDEKIAQTKTDINNASSSVLEIGMMRLERLISRVITPPFGIREFILCVKK